MCTEIEIYSGSVIEQATSGATVPKIQGSRMRSEMVLPVGATAVIKGIKLVLRLILFLGLANATTAAYGVGLGCNGDSSCGLGEYCEVRELRLEKDGPLVPFGQCKMRAPEGLEVTNCAPGTGNSCIMILEGEITKEKAAFIESVISAYVGEGSKKFFSMFLNSPGGDVYAAMRIGRLLRRNEGSALMASSRSRCASACIFVLAGAVRRNVTADSEVIVHRPYGVSAIQTSFESESANWKKMQADMRNYFYEMNIPPSLVDVMNEIPPHRGRPLSEKELSRYMLSETDPAYNEKREKMQAEKLGVSRGEFLKRKAGFERCMERLRGVRDLDLFFEKQKECQRESDVVGVLP